MKKLLILLTLLLCIGLLTAMPVSAATDPLAVKFQDALGLLDHFYDYDYHYMIRKASDDFISWENWDPVEVPAAEFDAALKKYFVITDQQIRELREMGNRDYNVEIYDEDTWELVEVIPFFNEASQIYTVENYGGFGGSMAPRSYLGYVKNGATYDVFYQNITYAYLEDYLPDDMSESEYADELDWPDFIDYAGIRFEPGPEGYFAYLSYDDFGRKYTVEMNGDTVRLISCTQYTKADLPDAFDDKTEVIYDLPQDSEIVIPENECFTPGTVVKVEKLSDGDIFQIAAQSMESVAESYQVYEFTATMENAAVQPDGKLAVTFAIPEGYSTDVAVYYMAPDGKLELVPFTVDAQAGTVTAQLSHFSTYIIVDNATKTHEHQYAAAVTPPTCTAEGYTTYTCDCGDSYVDNKTPVADHNFGQWIETKAPTADAAGEEKRECASCDHFETRLVEKLGDASQPTPESPDAGDSSSDAIATPDTDAGDEDDADDEGMPLGLIIGIAGVVVLAGAVLAILLGKKKK